MRFIRPKQHVETMEGEGVPRGVNVGWCEVS